MHVCVLRWHRRLQPNSNRSCPGCNPTHVHRSVSEEDGRLEYAHDVASAFEAHGVHSTLWIWRSYRKSSWGFELVHEDEARRLLCLLYSTLLCTWQ